MSGTTGKMTNAAILERGPRMVLLRIYGKEGIYSEPLGFVVAADPFTVFTGGTGHVKQTYARSYSLAYLLRLGKGAL